MGEIYLTEDGSHSVVSKNFDASYHSKYGAIAESQHVFINAAFNQIAPREKEISILELGFGTGLNAYLTFLKAGRIKQEVFYQTIEAYPLSANIYKKLNYPSILESNETANKFFQMHECEWGILHKLSDNFSFKKNHELFENMEFEGKFDIIYFDPFAPGTQPELWSESTFKKAHNLLKVNGILTTFCAKGSVKRAMRATGLKVEALPGPPHKREMTRAVRIE